MGFSAPEFWARRTSGAGAVPHTEAHLLSEPDRAARPASLFFDQWWRLTPGLVQLITSAKNPAKNPKPNPVPFCEVCVAVERLKALLMALAQVVLHE